MKKIIYFGIIIATFLCACRKPEKFPVIPEIRFIGFAKYQNAQIQDGAILAFYFQDGDGDIGLNSRDIHPPFDTSSIYYYNFFCDYYEKQNGVFVKNDSINLNARIPRLSQLPEESINGEIYITMPYYYDPFSPYNDTIQLKFYIVDRKLNKSNIEEANMIR